MLEKNLEEREELLQEKNKRINGLKRANQVTSVLEFTTAVTDRVSKIVSRNPRVIFFGLIPAHYSE